MAVLNQQFFKRDVLVVAPELIGKNIVRKFDNGKTKKFIITETEAYRGEEDLACHASKGRTNRTKIMYKNGGTIYIYLIYGMYWMLNIVTEKENVPQAVLIRGIEGYNGPGKLTKALYIDKSLNGKTLSKKSGLWLEDSEIIPKITTSRRIGINYAGKEWIEKPWRYILNKHL